MLVSIWQWNQWIDFLPANGVFISHTESQTWLRDSSQTLAPLSLVGFWALPPKFHAVQLFAKKGKHVKKGTWFLTRRKGCSSYCLGQSETTCKSQYYTRHRILLPFGWHHSNCLGWLLNAVICAGEKCWHLFGNQIRRATEVEDWGSLSLQKQVTSIQGLKHHPQFSSRYLNLHVYYIQVSWVRE